MSSVGTELGDHERDRWDRIGYGDDGGRWWRRTAFAVCQEENKK